MPKNEGLRAVRLDRSEVEEYRYMIDPDAIDRMAAGLEKGYLVHEDGPEIAMQQAADLRRMSAELRQGRAA
jgi:hypothetical protein